MMGILPLAWAQVAEAQPPPDPQEPPSREGEIPPADASETAPGEEPDQTRGERAPGGQAPGPQGPARSATGTSDGAPTRGRASPAAEAEGASSPDIVAEIMGSNPPPEDGEQEAAEVDAPPGGDGDSLPGEVGEIEELDLEALLSGEYVSAVSRTVESVENAPAIVTVVTREEILRWGYRSVAEILQQVPGFYVIDDHITPNLAVRGISGGLRAESGLVQVTIDGRPVVYRPTGGRWLGPELVPISIVERVEIVRGPTSTVYGADAFLGVINIVTRSPERLAGLELSQAGSYAGGVGGDFDFALGRRIDDVSFLLSWRLNREDRSGISLPSTSPYSHVPDYRLAMEDRRAHNLDLNSAVGLARVSLHFDANTTLSITTYASMLDRGAEFADWRQLTSGLDFEGRQRGSRVSLWHGYADVGLTARPDSHLSLEAYARAFGGSPTQWDHVDLGNDIFYVRRRSDFIGGEFAGSAQWSPIDELRFTFGLEGIADNQRLPSVLHVLYAGHDGLPPGSVRESTSTRQERRTFLNLGVYLLGSLKLVERLNLHAGVRYDYNNIYGSQVNGRVAAALDVLDNLGAKLIYGSAFRAPTALLLYGVPMTSGDILGNPTLDPQQIHSVEGQLRWRPWEWLTLQTGLSYSYLLNKAEFTRVGANLIARNVAEVGAWSWDSLVQLDWEEQLRVYASFSYVTGVRNLDQVGYRADLLGSDLEAYPPAMFRAGAHYTIPHVPLRFGTQIRYTSARRASDSNVLEAGVVYELPDAWYWDATLSVPDLDVFPTGRTSFTFTARNILGTTAPHPGFSGFDYPSAPRTFMLEWRQTF